MKKGLHLLGRKNQSLYDTNFKIPERESIQLVLDSESTVYESGTANVRARPTVKHHTSTFQTFQGFAVPTPTVPELPAANGPKINGTGPADHSSSGSVASSKGPFEEENFVPPPPPSVAPPPPPVDFIPPPPDFMGDLNTLEPAALQPPSIPAPKPPLMVEKDLSILKPPPMAPPKPPAGSAVPVSVPSQDKVPERPKFAPPQPPTEKSHKINKIPPTKPMRLSSISTSESPPYSPAHPPQLNTTTESIINYQNKPKVKDPQKTTFQSGLDNQTTKPKPMKVLPEPQLFNSSPVEVPMEGKAQAQVRKPEPKPAHTTKEVFEIRKQPEICKVNNEIKTEPRARANANTVPAQSDIIKPLEPPLQKTPNVQVDLDANKNPLEAFPGQGRRFSPLLDRKLNLLKANETTKPSPTSPMALLQAAKEREKNKASQSFSRESSTTRHKPTSPNSFNFITSLTPSIPSQQELQLNANVGPAETKILTQAPEKPMSSTSQENPMSPAALVKDQKLSTDPVFNKLTVVSSPAISNLADYRKGPEEKLSKSHDVQNDIPKQDVNVPLLSPPPEFGDFGDQISEPPPSIRSPDPPKTKLPTLPVPTMSPPPAPAKASAKFPATALSPTKLTPPDVFANPKQSVQTKSSPAPTQIPPNLSPNQATLVSILQKKMLEMDQKMAPVNNSEHNSDDWGTSFSDEDNKVPTVPQHKPETKNPPTSTKKPANLDMKELESKVAKKYQSTRVKSPTRNGIQSRHQYGKTFTIRPGTKQPITLVNKGNS